MWWLDPTQLFDHFLGWLVSTIVNCFDAIFAVITRGLLASPDVTNLPQVRALTGHSVWVVDTVYVLAFLAAGVLGIVAGGDERARYTVKDLAPRLVVGFVAAHFSPLITGQGIAAANGLTGALTPGDTNRPGALDAVNRHVHAAQNQVAAMLLVVIVAVITVLLTATMIAMLGRFAVLLVLATVAPLALACHALPQTDPVARLWWKAFGGCLVTPVLQAFTLQAGGWMLEDPAHLLPALGLPADPGDVVNLLIVVIMLWTTVKIPGLVRRYVAQGGRGQNVVATLVRVVVVQQLTRAVPGLGRAGRGVRAATR